MNQSNEGYHPQLRNRRNRARFWASATALCTILIIVADTEFNGFGALPFALAAGFSGFMFGALSAFSLGLADIPLRGN